MVCSDCSKLLDLELQLVELKETLKNVQVKLDDAQQLNFVLERYSLTLDNKLLLSQGAYIKLEKLVETLTNSRIVSIPKNIVKTGQSDHDTNESADENAFLSEHDQTDDDSDFQSFAIDGPNSDYQEDSEDNEDTEVEEEVFDDPTVSLITSNRKTLPRGLKRKKSHPLRRRKSHVKRPGIKSKDQEYIQGSEYRCAICSFKDSRLTKFYDHVLTHDGYRPFKCNFIGCAKTFNRMDSLKIHENVHPWEKLHLVVATMAEPPKAIEHRPQTPPKDIETFSCELCSFSSIYPSKLSSHIRDHPGYKPFKCNFCPKSFTLMYTLIQHRRVHTGERPYVCQVEGCGMAFDNQRKILIHKRKFHKEQAIVPAVKPFDGPSTSRDGDNSFDVDTDEELPSAFVERSHRAASRGNQGYVLTRKEYKAPPSRAIRDAVLGGSRKYNCEHCDFATNYIKYFEEHANKHPGYDKPFKCQHLGCFKAYRRGHVLLRHVRVHTGEKKFSCEVEGCGLPFKDRSAVDYHQFKMHYDIARKKGVHCPVEDCRKLFYMKQNLAKHLRSMHPELDVESTLSAIKT